VEIEYLDKEHGEQWMQEGHVFWDCPLNIAHDPRLKLSEIPGHKQVTDISLLLLAVHQGGKLSTFDRKIPVGCIEGGLEALDLIE